MLSFWMIFIFLVLYILHNFDIYKRTNWKRSKRFAASLFISLFYINIFYAFVLCFKAFEIAWGFLYYSIAQILLMLALHFSIYIWKKLKNEK